MSELIVLQNVRTIQLSKGKNTLIDETDSERAKPYSWCASKSRRDRPNRPFNWYAVAYDLSRVYKSKISLHRFVVGATPVDPRVDHRNGDSLDNRKENLRFCTATENARNSKRTWGKSKYKGVTFSSRKKKWMVQITRSNRSRTIGFFADERDAALAYDRAAIESYGEFACTNADLGLV